MGWSGEGSGLGKRHQGIAAPVCSRNEARSQQCRCLQIEATIRVDKRGLGSEASSSQTNANIVTPQEKKRREILELTRQRYEQQVIFLLILRGRCSDLVRLDAATSRLASAIDVNVAHSSVTFYERRN